MSDHSDYNPTEKELEQDVNDLLSFLDHHGAYGFAETVRYLRSQVRRHETVVHAQARLFRRANGIQ